MILGDLDVRFLSGGTFRLDGGAMFGVVPKTLWERKTTPDERNRIRLNANSLLVRTPKKTVLIETGNGTKWNDKLREIYAVEPGDPLIASLAAAGIRPEQVDVVINTHLHFDHSGGNTRLEAGRAIPTFPNAEYIVQRAEIEHALHPTERDRGSYFPENIQPILDAKLSRPVDGNAEILPGISLEPIPGHNADIQAVKLTGGGATIVFIADLMPTRHHVPLPWIMAYDLFPMQTLETKRKWLKDIVSNDWIAVFGHDPEVPCARFHAHDDKIDVVPFDLNS